MDLVRESLEMQAEEPEQWGRQRGALGDLLPLAVWG